ncbi:TolB family protein, partial [candidate division KSB1 bacterium]
MSKIFRKSICMTGAFLLLFYMLTGAQEQFTIEQVLSPAYPFDLVSAKNTDRIAWIEFERGMRNVYTAAAPDYTPVRLTDFMEDNGYDLSSLSISDDGAVVVFVRGHSPNRDGWIANPNTEPDGSERAVWAVRTDGGAPWRIVEASSPNLSPNGQWVLFQQDGGVFEVPVYRQSDKPFAEENLKPLFRAFGGNGRFSWSPDSKKIAFVSNRSDHSFIGIYDRAAREITYMSPGVDSDSSPSWSPDSKQIAFIRRPGSPFSRIVSGSATTGQRGTAARPQRGQTALGEGFRNSAFEDGKILTFWVGDVVSGEARKVWHNPPDSSFLGIRSIMWAGNNLVFQLERE